MHAAPTQGIILGILVHGDNHFIVEGPLPPREVALELVRRWSVIQIGSTNPSPLDRWRILTKAFRENLTWAVIVPGEGEISSAVAVLLDELWERKVAIHDSRLGTW